jgi:UPF0755 protein
MTVLKKVALILALILLGAAGVLTAAYLDLKKYAVTPALMEGQDQVIEISPGQPFKSTIAVLKDAGLITHPTKFELIARLKHYDNKLKAGEYVLSASMSPDEIFDKLIKGSVRLHKVTVPEGYTIHQIADLIAAEGFGSREDFLAAATNMSLARANGIDANTFEGYLFPDTYYFPKGVSIEKIVLTMLGRFREVLTPAWQQKAAELGFTVHQVVTLASIIEKETGDPLERPLISSVLHNRLKKGMRLEADPTVIYGIKDFDGNLTRKQLETPTPYNTYRIRGLPPGPIANPGAESLKAALFPADTTYLFFVAKKDNTHYFSSDLAEHNRAVRKYQLQK